MSLRRFLPPALALSLAWGVAASSAAPAAGAAAPPAYRVTDLGSLGGGNTRPAQINDRGMVTGDSNRHDRDRRGIAFFQWKQRFVGLPQRRPGDPTHGTGLNAAGTVVGYDDGGPFVGTASGVQWLPLQLGRATAINDDGLVVGSGGHASHAWMWKDGAIVDLGTTAGEPASFADAVNGRGDIVGAVGEVGQLRLHAMTYFDGVMQDLGTFGKASARATGVNDARSVCGTARDTTGGRPHAFVWHAGVVTWLPDFPDLGSEAHGIDAAGNVVGEAWLPPRAGDAATTQRRHAVLWRAADHAMVDLNDALAEADGWVLQRATSLNARGQVVGVGRHLGRTAGFRLDPAAP